MELLNLIHPLRIRFYRISFSKPKTKKAKNKQKIKNKIYHIISNLTITKMIIINRFINMDDGVESNLLISKLMDIYGTP